MGDFRVFAQTARLRETSPTLDRGDVRADQGRPTSFSNLLTNPSFEADLSGWTVAPAGAIGVANPPAYGGAKYFSSSNNPTTSVEQTIDLISKGSFQVKLITRNCRLALELASVLGQKNRLMKGR